MRPNFGWWTKDVPAQVFDLYSRVEFDELFTSYQGTRHEIVGAVIDQAQQAGATCVVVEYRYLDADYRNEHSRFYSTTFRRYPSVAHRLHFFREPVPVEALNVEAPSEFEKYGYVGYAVMRPVPAGPVGRTMLKLPDELEPHVSCKASDEVNLFGSDLSVVASPFMSQESQLGVCIHVTAWVCTYIHHLKFDAQRFLPGEIAAFAPVEVGRLVPAPAMSIGQLSAIFEEAGVPAVVYDLDDLPEHHSKFQIACRYLNSGFPVVVAGGGHAFVVVGYRRVMREGRAHIHFIRQDDRFGPYQIVEDPNVDRWRPWEYFVIPLPPKVYVSGEKAETVGADKLHAALMERRNADDEKLQARLAEESVVFRTTAVQSNDFKRRLAARGAPTELVAPYQWTSMSRWVWVVEAVDHNKWDAGEPCVLAEVIIDATDHTGDPHPLAWRIPNQLHVLDPDTDQVAKIALPDIEPLKTTCAVDAAVKDL